MKILNKTFLKKQLKTIVLLSVLSFLVLISIQITATTWSKNLTLINRIDQVKGSHTYIFTFDDSFTKYDMSYYENVVWEGFGIARFEEYLKRYDQAYEDRTKLHVERTIAFPYQYGSDFFVLGYTSVDGSHQFDVLQGKNLTELKGNEIAITESYARGLKKQESEILGSIISVDVGQETVDFEVASVIDFVNFNDGYVSDKGLQSIPFIDLPFTAAAYGNLEALTKLAQTHSTASKEVLQIRFENYSKLEEKQLIKNMLDTYGVDVKQEKIIAAYELSDNLSINEQLFKHISMVTLIGFLVATTYSFMVFLKRQLKQNARDIGLLTILGLEHSKIMNALSLRIGIIYASAYGLFALVNVIMKLQFRNNRMLAQVFDINMPILTITIIASLIYFLIIFGLYSLQIQKTIDASLHSVKTKQQFFIKRPQINQRQMPFIVAFRSLFAQLEFTLSSIVIVGILIFLVVTNLGITSQTSEIYNEETLGLNFDYVVTDVPFSIFELTQPYASDQSIVNKQIDIYFADINFSQTFRAYYKGNLLVFYNDIIPFTKVVHGDYPPEWKDIKDEYPTRYNFMLVSKKHMDIRDAFIYSSENMAKYRSVERAYMFYTYPNAFYMGMANETAAPINGTVNTLIDNGWISYDFVKRQEHELNFPHIYMYLINLKEDVDVAAFESQLDRENVQYMSFESVTGILNQANQINQRETFYFMNFMLAMLIVVLIVNSVAFVIIQKEEVETTNNTLKRLGVTLGNVRKIMINQYIIVMLVMVVLSFIFFLIGYPYLFKGVLDAYGLYYTISLNQTIHYILGYVSAASLVVILLINGVRYEK